MIKTNIELASAAEKVAKFSKTLYVLGCFGAPMNASNKNRYTNNLDFNKQDARKNKILQASADTFGFDCVCFIKGLLWGWEGNTSHQYGGATYQSNGVPDISANSMIKVCKDVSTDFSNIQVGEAVWLDGHIGLYIGDGLAAECTHRWKDGVQITRVHNILSDDGTPGRKWTKHGKLPYVTYEVEQKHEEKPEEKPAEKEITGCNVTLPILRKGDNGESVRAMQILLTGHGCKGKMIESGYGSFGGNTEGAVKLFQEKEGLTVDGIVGINTWKKLLGV